MEKRKRRVYISGKITGTDDYMERFAAAEKYLEEAGFSVINPARIGEECPKDFTHSEYMRVCFELLDMSDCVYMLRGWEESKGAKMEYEWAREHGRAVMYQERRA